MPSSTTFHLCIQLGFKAPFRTSLSIELMDHGSESQPQRNTDNDTYRERKWWPKGPSSLSSVIWFVFSLPFVSSFYLSICLQISCYSLICYRPVLFSLFCHLFPLYLPTVLSHHCKVLMCWSLSSDLYPSLSMKEILTDFSYFLLQHTGAHTHTHKYIFTHIFHNYTMKRIYSGIVLFLYLQRDREPRVPFSACLCLKCEDSQD